MFLFPLSTVKATAHQSEVVDGALSEFATWDKNSQFCFWDHVKSALDTKLAVDRNRETKEYMEKQISSLQILTQTNFRTYFVTILSYHAHTIQKQTQARRLSITIQRRDI